MEKSSFDVIVMGGGPGGIEAAITAAREGLSVVIVKNQKPGGRAVWGSLVPSKVWLKAAEAASVMRHGAFYALGAQECRFDITNLEARIVAQSESASGRYRQGLKEAGVTAVAGKGVILAPGTVQVKRETGESAVLNGRFIIVATGSEPVFSPDARPAPPRIFAPRHAASLPELPGKLLVVGGGVTGVEYGFVFAALGTPVAILHSGTQLMPRLDSRIAATLEDYLKKRLNIQIYKHDAVRAMRLQEKSVEAETAAGLRYQADYALLATGRAADLTFYDPAAISFAFTPEKALAADEFGQTSQPGIYAVGDVTGAPMLANRATMQARVAVMHLLKGDSTGLHPKPLIEMAYTYPPRGSNWQYGARHGVVFCRKTLFQPAQSPS